MGHFHTYAGPVMLNQRTLLANGTVESHNEYAAAELAAGGFPCQRLTYFDETYGLISDHQLFLDNTRQPAKLRATAWLDG